MTKLSLGEVALGRYAVTLLTTDERTATGLYLPSGRETLQNVGRIIKCGPPFESADDDNDSGAPSGPIYRVGEVVVFGKYNGNEITLNDENTRAATKFLIIAQSDILCTLKEEETNGTST